MQIKSGHVFCDGCSKAIATDDKFLISRPDFRPIKHAHVDDKCVEVIKSEYPAIEFIAFPNR